MLQQKLVKDFLQEHSRLVRQEQNLAPVQLDFGHSDALRKTLIASVRLWNHLEGQCFVGQMLPGSFLNCSVRESSASHTIWSMKSGHYLASVQSGSTRCRWK